MEPALEFVFQIKVNFASRNQIGELPSGVRRGYTPAAGGEITGPRLQGRVVPNSGADWAGWWPNGVVEFNAQYLLQATDDTLIVMKNRGFRHAPPDVLRRMEALEPVDPSEYYMRLAPTFEAPIGPHDWLTRTVFVGSADRRGDHSIFRYFAVV
ncbi:MAG: DUF3237 family protein [Stellaceae bacterium]